MKRWITGWTLSHYFQLTSNQMRILRKQHGRLQKNGKWLYDYDHIIVIKTPVEPVPEHLIKNME